MLLKSYKGKFDRCALAWARHVHQCIFDELPLTWTRKGTWIEAWNGRRRIAFAPHATGASLYFQGANAVERYRNLGGLCRAGKVSIHLPIAAEFENLLLTRIAAEHLKLPYEPT